MFRTNKLHHRLTLLSMKRLIILALCLGGFSAHFLANNSEHSLWQPAAEVSGPQADHGDHQEQYAFPIKLMPVDGTVSLQCSLLEESLYQFFPPLSPLRHPPKFS